LKLLGETEAREQGELRNVLNEQTIIATIKKSHHLINTNNAGKSITNRGYRDVQIQSNQNQIKEYDFDFFTKLTGENKRE